MKKIAFLIVFMAFSYVIMLFAACTEKENNEQTPVTTRQEQRLTVTYTVDAEPNRVTLKSVEAYRSLVGDLVGKTREGSEISVVLDNVEFRTVPTKSIDTVLVSDSLELVMEWIERMNYSGYDVVVRYDETTGTYHCKAQMPNDPMYQHVWQCDSNGFTIRLTFWNDSILYSEVYDDTLWDVYPFRDRTFYNFTKLDTENIFPVMETDVWELYSYTNGTLLFSTFFIDTLENGRYHLYPARLNETGEYIPCPNCIRTFVFVEL